MVNQARFPEMSGKRAFYIEKWGCFDEKGRFSRKKAKKMRFFEKKT